MTEKLPPQKKATTVFDQEEKDSAATALDREKKSEAATKTTPDPSAQEEEEEEVDKAAKNNDQDEDRAAAFTTGNYQPPTLEELQKEARKRQLAVFIVGGAIAVCLILLLGWGFSRRGQSPPASDPSTTPNASSDPVNEGLAGLINFSSSRPEVDDQGEIALYLRPQKEGGEFIDTGVRLPLSSSSWSYTPPERQKTYEVTAYLYYQGQQIAQSNIVTGTAPASNLILDFDLNWQEFAAIGEIQGTVKVDGYYPGGSRVAIVEDIPAATGLSSEAIFEFALASREMGYLVTGLDITRTHLLTAELFDASGNKIGVSVEKSLVMAGEQQANFTINSTATPPLELDQSESPLINGRITINGPLRANSRVVVSGRRSGTSEFQPWQVLTNMSESKFTWQYSGLIKGEAYDVVADLQVNGETVDTSRQLTIKAPNRSTNFTLNTNYFLQAPESQLQIHPCVQKGDAWETYVVIPRVPNAAQYWLTVGTAKTGTNSQNLYSQAHVAIAGPLSIRVGNLSTGKTNYARFAYAVCYGCGAESNYSPWSSTISFTCQ